MALLSTIYLKRGLMVSCAVATTLALTGAETRALPRKLPGLLMLEEYKKERPRINKQIVRTLPASPQKPEKSGDEALRVEEQNKEDAAAIVLQLQQVDVSPVSAPLPRTTRRHRPLPWKTSSYHRPVRHFSHCCRTQEETPVREIVSPSVPVATLAAKETQPDFLMTPVKKPPVPPRPFDAARDAPRKPEPLPWRKPALTRREMVVKEEELSLPEEESIFGEETEMVSNEELGKVRGAFIASNGMVIDIGLMTQTLVDSVLVEQSETTSENLANLTAAELQTLVQINEQGASGGKLGLSDVPQILTVIQNSRNDVQIDNFTILNVDVNNVAGFKFQTQIPLINNQIVAGIVR